MKQLYILKQNSEFAELYIFWAEKIVFKLLSIVGNIKRTYFNIKCRESRYNFSLIFSRIQKLKFIGNQFDKYFKKLTRNSYTPNGTLKQFFAIILKYFWCFVVEINRNLNQFLSSNESLNIFKNNKPFSKMFKKIQIFKNQGNYNFKFNDSINSVRIESIVRTRVHPELKKIPNFYIEYFENIRAQNVSFLINKKFRQPLQQIIIHNTLYDSCGINIL